LIVTVESQRWDYYAKGRAMSEINMDQINAEIEGEIRKYASSVELAEDETVLRVTISNDVVLGKEFAIGWWLDFIGQTVFQWDDRTFYCCDVEPTEDSHVWICHPIDLHNAFPIQTERGIEASNQGQLEHQEVPEFQSSGSPRVSILE
jgi:hypothetical protein